MSITSKFFTSLVALPILIPWSLSEKFFQYSIQPRILRKYQLGQVAPTPSRRFRLKLRYVVFLFMAIYLVRLVYSFVQSQGSMLAAVRESRLLFVLGLNDIVTLINFLLEPLNTILLFAQGGDVTTGKLLLSFYFLFLPLIFFTNLAYCYTATRVLLQRAVRLRNEADRDVHIVAYSDKAKEDEIFFGLDLNRNQAPFYAKVAWLQGHVQVIGAPGSGKTQSILQPLWFQSVRRNVPTIVVDGQASGQNVDRFYTIATSLAQGQEIIYFNPKEPARSATYNPLQHGSAEEIKNRLLGAIDWATHSGFSREKLDYYLGLVLKAMHHTRKTATLAELYKYFDSKMHVHNVLPDIRDPVLADGLRDLVENYTHFQKETAFFTVLLLQLCGAQYAHLLKTREPELDLREVFANRKDCYFSLPTGANDAAMRFLGRLILGDIQDTFRRASLHSGDRRDEQPAGNGILIIDEVAKFVSPKFIDLLRVSRDLGVGVCYTNQTLAELENPELHLTPAFIEEMAEHTNVIFCFNLSGPESVARLAARMRGGDARDLDAADIIRQLDVGRCLVFVRRPRLVTLLKTGYFKFETLLRFEKDREDVVGIT